MGRSERPDDQDSALERADTLAPSAAGAAASTLGGRPPARAAGPIARTTALSRGSLVSRYVVIDLIGAGGMGRVYAAFDPELSRQVALKVVSPGDGAALPDEARNRLLREAQAMARVSHPNVIPVFDVGTVDGDVFVAMELRHGATLTEWLRAPHTVREIVGVFVQAGRGLAAAHAVGLVHRDFKPDNVHVGDDGRVCVLDFGLARPAEGAAPTPPPEVPSDRITPLPSSVLTVEGAFIGTPQYMAPEQHRRQAADARTDQFSFCVALYEALYGQRPFRGRTLAELADAVTTGRLPRAPRSARQGEVPAWLRAVVKQGLSVRPEDRFASMDVLLRALDRRAARRRGVALGTFAVVAAGVATAYAVVPRPAPASAVCRGAEDQIAAVWNPARAAAVRARFAASGVPYADDSATRTIAALDDLAARWAAQQTQACEATRVRRERSESLLDRSAVCLERRRLELDAMARVLESAEAPVVERAVAAASDLISPETCLRPGDEPMAPPGAAPQVAAITARLAEASALRAAGRTTEALPVARVAAAEAAVLAFPPLVAEAEASAAELAIELGDVAAGLAGLERAYLAATATHMDRLAATLAIERAETTASRLGAFDDAHALVRVAEAWVARFDGDPALDAGLDLGVGTILATETRYAEAAERMQRALDRLGRLPATELRQAIVLVRLGSLRHSQGEHAEALALFQRAAALRVAKLGPQHPTVATGGINEAAVAIFLGRNQEAIATLDRSWPVLLAKLGPAHPTLAKLLNNRGLALGRLGRWQEAHDEHQRALAMLESLVPADSVELTATLINLGVAAKNLGRHDDALVAEARALAIYEQAYGPRHVDLAYPLTGLGVTWLLRGEPARALPPLERAWRLREATEVDLADRAETRFALARARWETGRDRAGALALAASARDDYAAAIASNPTLTRERDEVAAWLAEREAK